MAFLLAAYDAALTRSPILTKTLTSAFLFGAGDLMSQKLEGNSVFDWGRAARMTAWGGMFAPLAHVWYKNLDKWIPGQGASIVAKKVAADQLTWTIFINATFFFTSTMMATAGDVSKSVSAIGDKMWPTLKVNWLVWPVLTAFNLSMVPLPYRILFINGCSLFWSAFLSNMANKDKAAAPAPVAAATAPKQLQ